MNPLRFAVVVASGLFVSSCVGLDSAVEPFIGQDIASVVNRLGFPTEKREMLGHTIYTWKTGTPSQMYCDLDLVVDSGGKITGRNWNGNNGGCSTLAGRLR